MQLIKTKVKGILITQLYKLCGKKIIGNRPAGHKKRGGGRAERQCLVARQFAECLVQLVGNRLVLLLFVNQFVCKVKINKHTSVNTARELVPRS